MRKFEVAKGFENQNVILPARASAGSAGYDIRAIKGMEIQPGENVLVHTGVKVKMNPGEVLLVFIRSSLGYKRHLGLPNHVGVIDADYYGNPDNDGEIRIAMTNNGTEPAMIEDGERIAQGIFLPYLVTDDDSAQGTRSGGFGSTGKK